MTAPIYSDVTINVRTDDIPSRRVKKFYEMNPKKETLKLTDQLQLGDVVLIADKIMRGDDDLRENGNPYDIDRTRTNNYWCRIKEIRREEDQILFVGVYANGIERVRRYHKTFGWLVR